MSWKPSNLEYLTDADGETCEARIYSAQEPKGSRLAGGKYFDSPQCFHECLVELFRHGKRLFSVSALGESGESVKEEALSETKRRLQSGDWDEGIEYPIDDQLS